MEAFLKSFALVMNDPQPAPFRPRIDQP